MAYCKAATQKLGALVKEMVKMQLVRARHFPYEDSEEEEEEDWEEASDDEDPQYKLQGRAVSLQDVQNMLQYAASIHQMDDTTAANHFKDSNTIKTGTVTLSRKSFKKFTSTVDVGNSCETTRTCSRLLRQGAYASEVISNK